MSRLKTRIAGLAGCVALAAVAAAAQTSARPGRNALAEGARDFREVAERVRPALVQVLTTAETVVLDPAGQTLSLEVLRAAAALLVRVEAVERPDDPARFSLRVDSEKDRVRELGILGLDLDEELLALMPPLRARAGVVVAAAAPDAGPSADPLLPGDVIYSLNNRGVAGLAQLREALLGLPPGAPIVLQVERAGALRYVVVDRQ